MTASAAFSPRSRRVLAAFSPRSRRVLAAFSPRSRRVLAAFLVVCLFSVLPASAAPKPTSTQAVSQPPAFLTVRAELFAYLEKQTGTAPSLPQLPNEKLVAYFYNRQADASSEGVDDKTRLVTVGQNLRLSQKLLDEKDPIQRAQGLLIASETANFVAARLPGEKWLLARVYQGFVLPSLSLAHIESWQSPSRQNLIQSASYAFANAYEGELQIKMLQWLLDLGEKAGTGQTSVQIDTNTLDWARGTFASLLLRSPDAPLSDLERAVQLLQSIQSSGMKGFAHLQTQAQERVAQLKQRAA